MTNFHSVTKRWVKKKERMVIKRGFKGTKRKRKEVKPNKTAVL